MPCIHDASDTMAGVLGAGFQAWAEANDEDEENEEDEDDDDDDTVCCSRCRLYWMLLR